MTWQVLHLKDVSPSPWKNGGGTTRELVTWPKADDWLWRISVAEVTRSGPFSRFDGIERWFAVLEGDGVALSIGGDVHRLTDLSPPFFFDGGQATDCDLLGGATRDFNLMTRRGAATAIVARVQGPLKASIDATEIIAIYSISTGTSARFDSQMLNCEPHSLYWQVAARPAILELDATQALMIRIVLNPAARNAQAAASNDGQSSAPKDIP